MSTLNVEQVKRASDGLRGPLEADIASSDAFLSEAGKVLIKFHGSYEQTDRDRRAVKEYAFMVRSKLPGGQLTADQYLAHDAIASTHGNGTLRVTTRQGIQFHGVVKRDLRDTIRSINHALATTFGACGDVVRNLMCCPAHAGNAQREQVQRLALELSRATLPRTRAYHQIWLDGDPLLDEGDEPDPLYGAAYLPRKFKAGIAFAGDNCVDIFTHDAGFIAVFDGTGRLEGFNVVAGGGMGLTHNKDETFARLADLVGFVPPDHALETLIAIVGVHRDFGNRTNRKRARLKYVLHEWGLERFRTELSSRLSFGLLPPRTHPAFVARDHLGWEAQRDGRWSLGLPIESGRIADRDGERTRAGLRAILELTGAFVRLTPQQNVLLVGIADRDRAAVGHALRDYGLRTIDRITPVERLALACPALPTCGLALTEAERVLPTIRADIDAALADAGLAGEAVSVRVTGCPNGCARPYVAELALVGRSGNRYAIYAGGNREGTRLAEPLLDLVPITDVRARLGPLFLRYRYERASGEPFGDFCHRVGVTALAGEVVS
jgi:sulfite reductase (ferredoxin)